jgi:hypothetical protein
MDIHEKKEEEKQGYTPDTITRKMITGLVNARQRRLCRQNKLSKLTKPTEKELMEINCAKESVKSLIGTKYISEKPKYTNNSNWFPRHLNHNRVKEKVIKQIDGNVKKPIEINELIKDLRKNRENYIEQQVKTYKKTLNEYSGFFRAEPYIEPIDENNFRKQEVFYKSSRQINPNDEIINDTDIRDMKKQSNKILNTSKIFQNTDYNFLYKNTNKINNEEEKEILFLNFDNDIFRAVVSISNNKLQIIEKWYNDCELIFDIEKSRISLPNILFNNKDIEELNTYINNNLTVDKLNKYLNEFLPCVVENLKSTKKLKTFSYFYETNSTLDNDVKEEMNPFNIYQNDYFKPVKKEIKETFVQSKFKLSSYDVDLPEEFSKLAKKKEEDKLSEVGPYNLDYDALKPSLGDNSCNIEHTYTSNNSTLVDVSSFLLDINNKSNKSYTIIISVDYLTSLVLDHSTINNIEIVNEILDKHPEYGFIKLFTIDTLNENIINHIKTNFDKKTFMDSSEINLLLKQTQEFITYSNAYSSKNDELTKEKDSIIKYFKDNFKVNNEIDSRVKASTIYDHILKNKMLVIQRDKLAGFKNRLSQYLKEIGLNKKRYNDGYYYYGIVDIYNLLKL